MAQIHTTFKKCFTYQLFLSGYTYLALNSGTQTWICVYTTCPHYKGLTRLLTHKSRKSKPPTANEQLGWQYTRHEIRKKLISSASLLLGIFFFFFWQEDDCEFTLSCCLGIHGLAHCHKPGIILSFSSQ